MSKIKAAAALLLICLLTVSCSGYKAAESFFTLAMYTEDVIPSSLYLQSGETAAVVFYAAAPFSGIAVRAAKVSDSDVLRVSLYKFQNSVEETLKSGNAVEKAVFSGYENKDSLLFSFKTKDAGKYIAVFSTEGNAGICLASSLSEEAAGCVDFFVNGSEYKNEAFYVSVVFDGERDTRNYFISEASVPNKASDEQNTAPSETGGADTNGEATADGDTSSGENGATGNE